MYRETSSRSSIRSKKLNEFRRRFLRRPVSREPRNTGPKVPVDPRPSGYTVRDFLDDGEYLNAYEFAKAQGKPLMFGYGGTTSSGIRNPPVAYTDVSSADGIVDGVMMFVGRGLCLA